MPVTAAFEAEVLPGNLDPLEVLGRREHPLDQFAVFGLDPLSLHQGATGLGDSVGQLIANCLQLTKVEDPRCRGDRVDSMRDRGAAESLTEERSQLRLETANLAAQLESRRALVDPDPELVELLAFQQSGHPGKL